MRLLCALLTIRYTLRYWMHGGDMGLWVSGHEYGTATYEKGTFEYELGHSIPVEWEIFACERCGKEDRAWRRMPLGGT